MKAITLCASLFAFIASLLFAMPVFAAPTLSITGQTIAGTFVCGDRIGLSVTGGAPNAPVDLTWDTVQGRIPWTPFGTTDNNGSWSYSGAIIDPTWGDPNLVSEIQARVAGVETSRRFFNVNCADLSVDKTSYVCGDVIHITGQNFLAAQTGGWRWDNGANNVWSGLPFWTGITSGTYSVGYPVGGIVSTPTNFWPVRSNYWLEAIDSHGNTVSNRVYFGVNCPIAGPPPPPPPPPTCPGGASKTCSGTQQNQYRCTTGLGREQCLSTTGQWCWEAASSCSSGQSCSNGSCVNNQPQCLNPSFASQTSGFYDNSGNKISNYTPGVPFRLRCDFGFGTDAMDGNPCHWVDGVSNFYGSAAEFICPAQTSGTFTATCSIASGSVNSTTKSCFAASQQLSINGPSCGASGQACCSGTCNSGLTCNGGICITPPPPPPNPPPPPPPAPGCSNTWNSVDGGTFDKDGSGSTCGCYNWNACGDWNEFFGPGDSHSLCSPRPNGCTQPPPPPPPPPPPSQQSARIQGLKVLQSSGSTSANPPAAQRVTLSGAASGSSTANPYTFSSLTTGTTYTVTVDVPAGWSVGYTLCYNNTACHGARPTPGNSVSINVPIAAGGNYADLYWHFDPLPVCNTSHTTGGMGPDGVVTTNTSGTLDFFVYGVQYASEVKFAAWSDFIPSGTNPQDDIVWYPAVNQGGGTWKASIDLANHRPGNPDLGVINVHPWMADVAGVLSVPCDPGSFTRVTNTTPTAKVIVRRVDEQGNSLDPAKVFTEAWLGAESPDTTNPAVFNDRLVGDDDTNNRAKVTDHSEYTVTVGVCTALSKGNCSVSGSFGTSVSVADPNNPAHVVSATIGCNGTRCRLMPTPTFANATTKVVFKYTRSTPMGIHESASCSDIQGWACDAGTDGLYTQPVTVEFYKDAKKENGGVLIGSTIANRVREAAVGAWCGGNTNSGFVFTTPNSVKDNAQHDIYALAKNIGTEGQDIYLGGTPKRMSACTAPPPPPPTGGQCGDAGQACCPGNICNGTLQCVGQVCQPGGGGGSTGSIEVLRVDQNKDPISGTTAAVNNVPVDTTNPALFSGLPLTDNFARVSQLSGATVVGYGMCTYTEGNAAKCTVSDFSQTPQCSGTGCIVDFIPVLQSKVQKIVFMYDTRSSCSASGQACCTTGNQCDPNLVCNNNTCGPTGGGGNPQCSDGSDNDGDGLIDANDPDCHTDHNPGNGGSYNPSDNNEGGNPVCSDGIDNDGDGKIDCADSACHTDGNASNAASCDPNGNSEGPGSFTFYHDGEPSTQCQKDSVFQPKGREIQQDGDTFYAADISMTDTFSLQMPIHADGGSGSVSVTVEAVCDASSLTGGGQGGRFSGSITCPPATAPWTLIKTLFYWLSGVKFGFDNATGIIPQTVALNTTKVFSVVHGQGGADGLYLVVLKATSTTNPGNICRTGILLARGRGTKGWSER